MKALFVSHGSPTILVEDNPWKKLMSEIGRLVGKPETVVTISPHFISWKDEFLIEVSPELECIQDYYGFPDELYKFCYSAQNDLQLVEEIVRRSESRGVKIVKDDMWGLDHGAWIPLSFMFPGSKAVSISISQGPPSDHLRLGEVIDEACAGKNVILLGTGSPTHRLDLFSLRTTPKPSRFDQKLIDMLREGRKEEILDLPRSPTWLEAQPEGDLKPLYVILGAVRDPKAEILGYSVPWTGVSMLAALFRN